MSEVSRDDLFGDQIRLRPSAWRLIWLNAVPGGLAGFIGGLVYGLLDEFSLGSTVSCILGGLTTDLIISYREYRAQRFTLVLTSDAVIETSAAGEATAFVPIAEIQQGAIVRLGKGRLLGGRVQLSAAKGPGLAVQASRYAPDDLNAFLAAVSMRRAEGGHGTAA